MSRITKITLYCHAAGEDGKALTRLTVDRAASGDRETWVDYDLADEGATEELADQLSDLVWQARAGVIEDARRRRDDLLQKVAQLTRVAS